MKNLIDFFLKAGQVKRMKQRGLVLRGVKDPALIGSHSFREVLMGWIFARMHDPVLNSSRIMKMALLHDLARGYAGDITPYDPILKKHKGADLKEVYKKWARLPQKEKQRFFQASEKKEHTALKKLIKYLPFVAAQEIESVWQEYHVGITKEARFVYQLHTIENFLQALEYWQDDKTFPIESWWHQMKELITNPLLIELLEALDKKFHQKK